MSLQIGEGYSQNKEKKTEFASRTMPQQKMLGYK